MDATIGLLLSRFQQAGILDKMNVILVSDHGNLKKFKFINFKINRNISLGMAQMLDTVIVKDNVDINLIDSTKTVYNIVSNIYAKNPADVSLLFQDYSSIKKYFEIFIYFRMKLLFNLFVKIQI
jgi:hypothetical protein